MPVSTSGRIHEWATGGALWRCAIAWFKPAVAASSPACARPGASTSATTSGALENWVRLQNEGWDNFHMVADWHMLTTGFEDTSRLQSDTVRHGASTGWRPDSIRRRA